jgi:excisionase family DNA binding protein
MSFKATADVPTDVCGTFYASKVLGVSVAKVQALVERGELEAWRTKGGHRRISMQSVKAYLNQHGSRGNTGLMDANSPFLRVLVVDDDAVALELFRNAIESWGLPIDASYMSSAMEAMMDITSVRPDVLISDLRMPGVDGFEFLRAIRANSLFAGTLMLVVTALSDAEIQAGGPLPRHTHVMHKPVSLLWLQGFLTAMVRTKEVIADFTS